uniref:TPX2 C-terminal domain-containing protein n=1 Tax=Rhipicephalus zambeziensis TaxID=60191 RepID=A0A224YHN9_9ACAR
MKTLPRQKREKAKRNSRALQQKSREATTADKSISSGKTDNTPSSRNCRPEGSSSVNSDKQIETTGDGMKTLPRQKREKAKRNSRALQQKSREATTADKSISSGKTDNTPSSRNCRPEGSSSVNSDKLRTGASAATKEKSGTKGGDKKKMRALAAAKMFCRPSSSQSIRTTITPLPQGRKQKLLNLAKTRRSGKVQYKESAKMDAQYRPMGRPQQKAKNNALVKNRAPSSSATEMDKFKATCFKAKPAPDSSHMFRLRSTSAPLTKPKPFRLASLERHKESLMEFQKKKERMEAERLEKTKFVARPVPRSIKERSKSVDNTGAGTAKPGPSEHVSRPRRR